MNRVKIGRTKYNIPSGWNEISIQQYYVLSKMVFTDLDNIKNVLNMVLSVLGGVSEQDFNRLSKKKLIELFDLVVWVWADTPVMLNEFTHNGISYRMGGIANEKFVRLMRTDDLKLCSTDVDKAVAAGDLRALPRVVAYWVTGSGDVPDFSENVVKDRVKSFETLPAGVLLGFWMYLTEQVGKLNKQFEKLFSFSGGEHSRIMEKHIGKYGWLYHVHQLAGGDLSRYDSVFTAPIGRVLRAFEMNLSENLAYKQIAEITQHTRHK